MSTQSETQVPIKRSFLVVFLIVATELIGFGLLIPILPQIVHSFESNGLLLAISMAAFSFAQAIASPLLGSWSDRIGRKPVLLISKLGTVFSYILLAYSQQYIWIVISRLIDGFTGGNIAVARAYISDITTEKQRSKGMALIGISFATGFILGPALGGICFSISNGHQLAAFVAAGFSALAFILTAAFLKESPQRQSHPKVSIFSTLPKLLSHRGLATVFATQFIFMIIFSAFETSFSLYTLQRIGLGAAENSQLYLFIGILALIIQGSLMRFSLPKIYYVSIVGLLFAGLSFSILNWSSNIPTLLIGLATLCIGVALLNVHLPTLATLASEQFSSGQVMGVFESIASISRIIGPFVIYHFAAELTTGYWALSLALFIWAAVLLAYRPQSLTNIRKGGS